MSVEFNSLSACEDAKQSISKEIVKGNAALFCVSKGDEFDDEISRVRHQIQLLNDQLEIKPIKRQAK
jgi:hypothetical protein